MKEFLEYAKSKGIKEIDVDILCLLNDFFKETKNEQFAITDVVVEKRALCDCQGNCEILTPKGEKTLICKGLPEE